MRKRWLTLAMLAIVTVLLASMFAALRGSNASAAHKAAFSACLVTDIGGLYDKSFNHLAFVGLQQAEKSGIKGRVIQSKSPPTTSRISRRAFAREPGSRSASASS